MYVLVAPCILSEDLRAEGITTEEDRKAWAACRERCRQFGIRMVPLPCPETRYLGTPRAPGSFLDRLNHPDFFRLMDELEASVRGCGDVPAAIIGVNSSPTCGVTSTYYTSGKSGGPGMFLKRLADIAPLVDVREFAKYRIYLAAPLFSAAEKQYNRHLADLLAGMQYQVYLPQNADDTADFRQDHREEDIYRRNLAAIREADILVGVIDGADADSGTAWEMGYATALGKRVIALRTDFRSYRKSELVNLMLEQDAEVAGSEADLLALLDF
jgi:nucleoside 2-deoxyribosyltransferase